MTAYIVVHGHAVHLIVDVASIEAPGLAPGLAPQDLPGLAVHPEGEVVPVDHALAHGGVAAQQVVALPVHQHVEHLAVAARQPVGLAPLHGEAGGELHHRHHVHVLAAQHGPGRGAQHEPRGVLPDLGDLAHALHLQEGLGEDLPRAVEPPHRGPALVRDEDEAGLAVPDVARTHDVRAVHHAGPGAAVLRLGRAEHAGPQHGAGLLVQRHHGRLLLVAGVS